MNKRRFPRLSLTTEQFKLNDNGKVYAVTDLARVGMGLRILDNEDLAFFPLMREITGSIKIRDEKYEVKARVRNVRRDLVGCEFFDMATEIIAVIEKFLDPVRLGPDLKPVPLEEVGATWYHAISGTDVLIWKNPQGQIHRFGVYIFGSYVQWDLESGLSTGRIAAAADEETVTSGILRLETMILDPDHKADDGKVGIAKSLILSSNLAKELQNDLLLKLAGAKNGS